MARRTTRTARVRRPASRAARSVAASAAFTGGGFNDPDDTSGEVEDGSDIPDNTPAPLPGVAPGVGFGGNAPVELESRSGYRPGGGVSPYEQPNSLTLRPNVWQYVGPFDGPVVLVPVLTAPSGVTIAHPHHPEPLPTLSHRSAGKGSLYLPWNGPQVWAVKHEGTLNQNFVIISIQDPAFGAYLLGSLTGASNRPRVTRVNLTATPTVLKSSNVNRFAIEIGVNEPALIQYDVAPTFVSITDYTGRIVTPESPLLLAGDSLHLGDVRGVRFGATDVIASVTEWTR